MQDPGTVPQPKGRLPGRGLVIVAVTALVFSFTACGDDDGADGSGGAEAPTEQDAQELLGPEDPASGEPVRIGMVSDGATDAFDNRDELRAAEATAEFWNTHRGGVGGRPVEVVPCETGAQPAGAADCANQLVEEGVVAVALSQSAVTESLWDPLHAAGVPTFLFQASGEAIASDPQSSFTILNPVTQGFALPISVAESEDADRIAFVVIDVPQALSIVEEFGGTVLEDAGLDYDVVAVPPGTADMTSQMQEVASSDAGVVYVVGNDAFCIAAFNGLTAVGYDGAVASITQCITDATREAVPGEALEGMYISASMALGATDDPTFQLYQAVMSTFGDDVEDVQNATSMGGYISMAALLTSLDGIQGDITPETVIATIKAMPEQELPGGAGMTFRCGGSAVESLPAVCANQSLRTQLDANGQPTTYEVFDTSELMPE
jgi:branched-chain amino acid transport system substrate-binding protein